ncbi:hypothetical protein AHF37_06308 [Paragonimus kellicotti]|nr:hypothetical protein AHF37_06308 [Paragonimus kellicotti]
MSVTYNTRNPAVKRLLKEAQELSEPTELYHAQPLEDNLFEWHFTIRGPEDTEFFRWFVSWQDTSAIGISNAPS